MKKSLAIAAAAVAAAMFVPAGANAQMLSANVGGVGASIGGSSYGYSNYGYSYPSSSYSNYYYPNYSATYSSPVSTTVRYDTSRSYPSGYYRTSYNTYPSYYNTGYSYPANYYGTSNYRYAGSNTGVSVGVGW